MDTSGFYQLQGTMVVYSVDAVYFADGTNITRDTASTTTFPVNNWYWFNSASDAYTFFGLPLPQ